MGYITEARIKDNMFYAYATDYGNCVAYFKVYADDKQIAEYTGSSGGGGYPIPAGTKVMHAVGMDAGAGSPQTPRCQSGYEVNRISVDVPLIPPPIYGGNGNGNGIGNGKGGIGELLLLVGIAAAMIYLIGGKK